MRRLSGFAASRDIAIVGRACRLPGAASVPALWRLLIDERCAVGSIPPDRWPLDRYFHPRVAERGMTYTWAAGVLDDIWGFDAAAFGLSPREAEQMDPQQRLLLEIAWEALEDAGIRPSRLAGSETGVFVGASSVDHANPRLVDMVAADAYMMTGNTLSVIANRLSYIFDLRGPSLTVDTACSSSLVAVHAAVASLRSGRVDTAIVAGINLLVSPQSFIGFSQAAMLSRRGLCQAFSAQADGYVRAEGGVVLVLQTMEAAARDGHAIKGVIVDADVNSDGRTNGISLPSRASQARLIERLYSANDIDPAALAFVEAHGTGTPVGDPIEAAAIGETLGRRRRTPLPIGSLKTNIGHMEAAAGIGGLLKAMLALEHDQLPASLHCAEPNPAIDFAGLNIEVARRPTPLARSHGTRRLAGVNAFGFGGTNAHVVLADPPSAPAPRVETPAAFLVLSAHGEAALAALAADYARRFRDLCGDDPPTLIAAAATRRDRLSHRIVMPVGDGADLAGKLESAGKGEVAGAAHGKALARAAPVAFVFSGNGSQFVGMGRPAYEHSTVFRNELDAISQAFEHLAGWSIVEMLHADDLADHLRFARIAQPLLFAIQSAACASLRHMGLAPALVLGHSVGEVAAAEAAGLLDRAAALSTIHARSLHQELASEQGGMAVVIGPRSAAEAICTELPGLEIAAFNSPRACTVSGDAADLARLPDVARRHSARVLRLDLAYPFHHRRMQAIEQPLRASLADLTFGAPHTPFLSTVDAEIVPAGGMDAVYWWRNVREPVRFSEAIAKAHARDIRLFIEVGPMPTLLAHIGETLEDRDNVATLAALHKRDDGHDPLAMAVAAAIARGAEVDETRAYGSGIAAGSHVPLPSYPWQRTPYRLREAAGSSAAVPDWHPLIGARTGPDRLEWRVMLDTALHPWLADHRVEGRVILPGAAFAEMALAVAGEASGNARAIVSDLEISSPLELAEDVSRDVLCRLSPVGIVEILSRPRLSASPWQLHATGKIVREPPTGGPQRDVGAAARPAEAVSGAAIYEAVAQAGLVYGPAFRKLRWAVRKATNWIMLALVEDPETRPFGLDPMRLDACFHALALLAWPGDNAAAAAFVPVRFGEIQLHKPAAVVTRAEIEILRQDDRALLVDLTLLDMAGDVVALLRQTRFRPLRAERRVSPSRVLVERACLLASEPTASRRDLPLSLEKFRAGLPPQGDEPPLSDRYLLLEGWATSLAFDTMRRLAAEGVVRIDDVTASGALPGRARPWLERTLLALERSGLCRAEGRRHVFDRDTDRLPTPDEILHTIAHRHQSCAVELLAAAAAQRALRGLLAGERPKPYREAVVDYEADALQFRAPAEILAAVIERSRPGWPSDRAMRILQVGHGPLTEALTRLSRATSARMVVLETDPRRRERAQADLAGTGIACVETAGDLASFDLVVAASMPADVAASAGALRQAMAPEAILAVIEPAASLFRDFVLGLRSVLDADGPRSAAQGPADLRQMAASLGLEGAAVDEIATPAGPCALLTARAPAVRRRRTGQGRVAIIGDPARSALTSLATLLASSGFQVSILPEPGPDGWQPAEAPSAVVVLSQPATDGAPALRLRDRCLRIKQIADRFAQRRVRLWLVSAGAAEEMAADAAAFAFARTLANEMPMIDVRRVEVASGLREDLAPRLRDLLLSETAETEIILDAAATRVVRFRPLAIDVAGPGDAAPAARLDRDARAGADRVGWQPADRVVPGRGEVEIGIEAVGVNFRDVMLGLGLLPDDILEHGFVGPTLGLECVGRILRVGEGVASPRPGERVMAFARGAFATHALTPAALTAPLPDDLSSEAAATIPVAFTTAYYALVTCARLRPREWVLIHGAAGGVGLAALQIARWRGARVIATAGSPGKRALVRALGAEHVFDSRSGRFVDDVRRVAPRGVAVVLNSLSGDAMERSLGLLRPFGRFVELGKRDYVANTHVGLRPFSRNLTYFGVDLDQLLVDDARTSRRVFQAVTRLFARGALVPLPYRIFEAGKTVEAFRTMQRAGHVGKLVVRPPDPARVAGAPKRRTIAFDGGRAHLVTGGCGGFGLATARWLVAHGARTLVLVGRRGVVGADARAAVDELEAQGVRIVVETIDVADRAAMAKLFARFGADLPPLSSVFHAAMVLDDALLANLTAEQLDRVLSPKVAGAEVLDALTRDAGLDHFVLYSSVTTVLGNPGQAAYVAANGYLEGLARRRRAAGLAGLAVAWGAIADVGVLARAADTRALLETRAGVKGMPAQEALACLGEVLAAPEAHDAVVTIAPMDWSAARRHLPILATPAYRELAGEAATAAGDADRIDIAALVARMSPAAAREAVADMIVAEIARVLRMPRADIVRTTPLAEIGLDSLMAVELALGLEGRLTLAAPLSTSAASFSVNALADHIIAVASGLPASDEDIARRMMGRHVGPEAAEAAAVDPQDERKPVVDHDSSTGLVGWEDLRGRAAG